MKCVHTVMILLVVFLCGVVAQRQPMYAIGSPSLNYRNYEIYTFPSYDIDNFISAYNGLGGLPSLGISQSSCNFNVIWNGYHLLTCSCPLNAPFDSIVSVAIVNNYVCLSNISSILPITYTNDIPDVAFYKSTLNPDCNSICSLHGTCVNSECICSPGWSGSDCDQLITPQGYYSTLATIVWNNLSPQEFFSISFNPNPNCTMYLASMPKAAVQTFGFSDTKFAFSLENQEQVVSIGIWIQTEKSINYCFGTSFTGSTSTTVTLEIMSLEDQPLGDTFSFTLPPPQ